jgi:hypothetical protein
MKTARFFLMIVGSGALMLGLGYAGEPSAPATHENHTTSDRPADQEHGHVQDRPKQLMKSHEDSGGMQGDHTWTKRASVNDLQQSGLKRAAAGANDGLVMNKMETRREEIARLPVGGGTTALAPGVVRGRSATAAGIGGLAASTAKNSAAAINGTGMNRRRY